MNPLELVKLPALMQRTSGRPQILIALIDGSVLMDRPDLWSSNVRHLLRQPGAAPPKNTDVIAFYRE